MSQLSKLLRLQQYDNGSWGYKGIDDCPDENMLDGRGFGEGLKVINEQRDDEDREAFFARINNRPNGKEYGSDLEKDSECNSCDDRERASVADDGYGLNKLIKDVYEDTRCAVAEQGYGLDKLVNDRDPDVRRCAKYIAEENGLKIKSIKDFSIKALAKCLIEHNVNPAKYRFMHDFLDARICVAGIDFDKMFKEHPELGYEVGSGFAYPDDESRESVYEFIEMTSSKFGYSWLITWGENAPWDTSNSGDWYKDGPERWYIKTSDGKTCMDLFIPEDSIDKNEYIKVAYNQTNGKEYAEEHPEAEYCYVRKSSYDPDKKYDSWDTFQSWEITTNKPDLSVIPPAEYYPGYFLNKKEIDRLLNPYEGAYDLYFTPE